MSGHAEEGEKNTSMEASLHVNNLRGWGHPLIELSGHIAQVGVQALLQGLVEDNLSQATEEKNVTQAPGLGRGLQRLMALQPWSVANTPTPRDGGGMNKPKATHKFLKLTHWK